MRVLWTAKLSQPGVATALATNTFTTPAGYEFDSWNTKQDGTGTSYTDGQSVTDLTTGGTSIMLYAQWKKREPINLYNAVATAWANEGSRVMTNDTNANTGIQAPITTTNSGIFKYNPSVFGTASDAANTHDIYFYRGILDSNLDGTSSTYGSAGDGVTHPNYVILDADGTKDTSDTCWRIVRTTGSGGVKMIYNGKWTGSTCANATSAAQVTTSAFNGTSSTYQQIVRVGYTYNSTYATNTSKSGTIAQIFGSNSNPSVNNTRSDIKVYIEDTWYPSTLGASGSDYTSILEPSAGYCNDRTMNTSTSWTTPLAESTTIASTYGTSGQQDYYFGAYPRNMNAAQPPSLTCGNKYSAINRSTVDLYRYVSGSTGVSNQLKYPAALLTADEASFAGSGRSTATQDSAYHYNSYLRSGSNFWLLSPHRRYSSGAASGFSLSSNGRLSDDVVDGTNGVRPAISLTSGTTATSGSGTAADPWVVEAPKTMQSVTSDQLAELMPNEGDTTTLPDARDGQEYSIAKINGAYWMTRNLAIGCNGSGSTYGSSVSSKSLTSTDSNVSSGWSTPTALLSAASSSTQTADYTTPRMQCNSTYGAWYNYAAATAGTITGSSNSTAATYDICPKNWHLPAYGSSTSEAGSIRSITSYSSAFSPVTGGHYYNGSLLSTGYGRWWSATVYSTSTENRYAMYWSGSSSLYTSGYFRYYGFYVRCVRS